MYTGLDFTEFHRPASEMPSTRISLGTDAANGPKLDCYLSSTGKPPNRDQVEPGPVLRVESDKPKCVQQPAPEFLVY